MRGWPDQYEQRSLPSIAVSQRRFDLYRIYRTEPLFGSRELLLSDLDRAFSYNARRLRSKERALYLAVTILVLGYGPVFEPLADPDYFAQVRVDDQLGTVVCPTEPTSIPSCCMGTSSRPFRKWCRELDILADNLDVETAIQLGRLFGRQEPW